MEALCRVTATHAFNGQPSPGAVGKDVWVTGKRHRRIVVEYLAGAVSAGAEAAGGNAAETCNVVGNAMRARQHMNGRMCWSMRMQVT